jgi:hypothetical protein
MTESATADVIGRLCAACTEMLEVNGAGVSIMTRAGGSEIVASSGLLAAQIEEWQFSLGVGPCRDAYNGDRPIMVGDVGADTSGQVARWPVFGDLIHEAGVHAIFAFPVRVAGAAFGALDIFRSRIGPLSAEQVGMATAFADLAGALLPAVLSGDHEALGDAAPYRFEVHQAAGMVSGQLGIPVAEALLRLRARAFAEGRSVSELASDVVARRFRFHKEDR